MKVHIIRSLREDSNNKTGIGYYADFLEEQTEINGDDVFTTCFEVNFNRGFQNLLIHNIIRPIVEIIRNRKNAEVVHATAEHCSIFLPFCKGKKIVTVHHVIKKKESNKSWTMFWNMSALIFKIYADEFIAISSSTKEDMIKILKIPEEKITVLMHPPNSDMHVKDFIKKDILFFVGVFSDRKNPFDAVLVFKKMLEYPEFEKYRLIMCGTGSKIDAVKDLIFKLELCDSVDFVNNLSVDELRSLYGSSRFLLNTSKFEGLGITTLEAQMCGTPVLYFNNAEIPPEVVVAAIPCHDIDDMAMKALELLRDEDKMKKIIEHGITYSNNFGKNYAESLKEIYRKNNDRA